MSLSQAELDRLTVNITAAQDWVENDAVTDATADNGNVIKSISKINAEGEAVWAAAAAGVGYEVPVAFTTGLYIERATQTVDELGVIYAPVASGLPCFPRITAI